MTDAAETGGRRISSEVTDTAVIGVPDMGAVPAPTEYRTFSRKLAPALGGVGGVLVTLGGLGTWVRATEVQSGDVEAAQVAAVLGRDQAGGWLVAVVGVLAVVAALFWLRRGRLATALPLGASLIAVSAVLGQLPGINEEVAGMVDAAEARDDLAFTVYHVMFGWGAWFMIAGSVLLGLSALVGLLRTFDMRKGFSDAS